MRTQRVLGIVRKDLRAVARSRVLMLPLVAVSILFFVILPLVVSLLGQILPPEENDDLATFLRALPSRERARIEALPPAQQLTVLLFGYQFAPLVLIVPLATTTVIAADGLAGERERRTLESLLATPVREDELFLGKLLAPAIPALLISWLGTAISAAIVAGVAGVGPPVLPSPQWLVFAFLGSPAATLLGLGVVVLLSSRVRGMQEVSQLSGLVVLPIFALLVAQSSGVVLFDWRLAALLCTALWVLALVLLRLGRRLFERESLLRLG